MMYYTLDNTLPTSNSLFYSGPFALTNSATVNAIAAEAGFNNSVAANALFTVRAPVVFTSDFFTNGVFELQLSGVAGKSYILQGTTDFTNWIPLSTNLAPSGGLILMDAVVTNFPYRFYRAVEQP